MTDQPIVSDDLETQLNTLKQKRLEACQSEIEAVLLKHKCTLTGVPVFKQASGGAWIVGVEVGVTSAQT